ncbi:MAG: hypothetical protein KKF41_05065 [Actinobacteria bacterium]|nr:hypothetical protein [Actinomycetota bacterium]MBU1943975.1 hypothetical protein [Actinomycetota bacterium]MBU2686937.1 hypothetical protein [Actinomycetota bacterium]
MKRMRKRWSRGLALSVVLSMVVPLFIWVPTGAATDGYFPYLEESWACVRHDNLNSDYTTNVAADDYRRVGPHNDDGDEYLDGGAMTLAVEEYGDSGGLNDVACFNNASIDDAAPWRLPGIDGWYGTSDDQTGVGVAYLLNAKNHKAGAHSDPAEPTLVAYNLAGEKLWTSGDWLDDEDNWIEPLTFGPMYNETDHKLLDYGGTGGQVLIDEDHRIYICDSKYMWKASYQGDLLYKWRMPAEMPVSRTSTGFSSAFFTGGTTPSKQQVGGVHSTGRVTIFKRNADVTGLGGHHAWKTIEPYGYRDPLEIGALMGNDAEKDVMPLDEPFADLLWYPGKRSDGTVPTLDGPPDDWMVDPSMQEKALSFFMGIAAPVGNSPAIWYDPATDTSRIFYLAFVDVPNTEGIQPTPPDDTRLMRVDYRDGLTRGCSSLETNQAWAADESMGYVEAGDGSATSPDILADGSLVVFGCGDGHFYGYTQDGERAWRTEGSLGGMFGSPSTTRDGLMEIHQAAGGTLWELDRASGTASVRVQFDLYPDFHLEGTQAVLGDINPDPSVRALYGMGETDVPYPVLRATAGVVDSNGTPVENDIPPMATVSGVPVATPNELLVPLVIGYPIHLGQPALQYPVKAMVVRVPRTGRWPDSGAEELVPIKDTVEVYVIPTASGDLWVPHSGMMSSLAEGMRDYDGSGIPPLPDYRQMLVDLGWDEFVFPTPALRNLEPSGGISLFRPAE